MNEETTKSLIRFDDGVSNRLAQIGLFTNNQSNATWYVNNFLSRDRSQLEQMYRTSWICGKAVDTVAADMTKAGIEINSELEPDDIESMMDCWGDLAIWDKLRETEVWARLYGGGIGVILIDGQRLDTELRIETIAKNSFKGILPLDRWQATADLNTLVKAYGPEMGLPMFYQTVADRLSPLPNTKIHHTRCIRLIGQPLPYWQRQSEMLWGQSVLERIRDRVMAFDSATQGAAQLIFKAHLRTVKIEGFRDVVGTGGQRLAGLQKSIEFMRLTQTNEGITILDAKDDFEAHAYTFSGLDNVLLQLGQQLSGSIDIPLVKLFGQSPAGLNATGESDLQNYDDSVKQSQESKLRRGIRKLLDITSMSIFGVPMPKGWSFTFRPIRSLTEMEKATVANTGADAITKASELGMSQKTGLQELKALSKRTDFFGHISAKDIETADDTIPEVMSKDDLLGNTGPEAEGSESPFGKKTTKAA